jgi:replicative DNA helicase
MLWERVLPQSIEAEGAVLSAILHDKEALGLSKKWLKASYFYSAANRMIFESMEELAEKGAPIDLISLDDWMSKKGILEKCGGVMTLANLVDYGGSVHHVEYYSKLIWQAAVKRQLVCYATELVDVTCESGQAEAKEIIGRYVDQMREISEMLAREEGVLNIQDSLQEFMREIEEAQERDGLSGIPYGIPTLDRVTGGMHPAEVVTIVARLGVGKTWFELFLNKEAWTQRKRTLFISMEMPSTSVRRRFMAMVSGVPNMDLRMGRLAERQLQNVIDGCGAVYSTKDAPIFVIGADLIETVNDIDAFIDGLRPELVFVDGVYLLDDGNKRTDSYSTTTKVIRDLKKVAARRDLPIVTAAQFNREASKKGGMGGAEDIGFTDAIGQTSDVVIALAQNEDQERNRIMVVRNLKNREGIKVEFQMLWDLDLMRFEEIGNGDEPDDEEIIMF